MGAEPSQGTRGSKLRSNIGWWLGALSAGVGILAFFLTRCESKAPSFSDWKGKVNAICEQEGPQITNKIEETRSALIALDKPNPTQSELDSAAVKHRNVGAAFSHLVGSWRGLEQPDEHKGDIEQMYSAGQRVSDAYYNTAAALAANEHTIAYFQAHLDEGKKLAIEVRSLDLDQCEMLIGAPEDWDVTLSGAGSAGV
ncbi:hypothetical protein [Streptomyces africanus]|uniref:hypothetical protein n=1 Tax=Streptomyces africanus TaxID=231024 RepID=UPI0011809065|nr:hypothetical protein [Streptomyces africanus]